MLCCKVSREDIQGCKPETEWRRYEVDGHSQAPLATYTAKMGSARD